ncbi:MAG: inosine monophosphate cyclohydrolase [SAR324 cluster bacterium]|nr:inosine monophosphate cyclohydrolase [SAR324 cluster bacterium]
MLEKQAVHNLETHLRANPYPGRGIIIGRNDLREWMMVYWIMGRSANSRNRQFVYENNILKTTPADPAKVSDPSLIIYNAFRVLGSQYIVTNGSHTDVIHDGLKQGKTFEDSLQGEKHEPDAPNFTPRISGLLDLGTEPRASLSILTANPFKADTANHAFYRYPHIEPGYGYLVTTYQGDGSPLPSFSGTPLLVPLRGNLSEIAQTYWNALNSENRISLAVIKAVPDHAPEMVLLNQYS